MALAKRPNAFSRTAKGYAASTTIHGIQYIFEEKQKGLDRVLWIIAVGVSIFLALLLSFSAYIEWKENPVLTTVGTTGYPIEKVDYPAITICAQVILNHFQIKVDFLKKWSAL